jgi:hypothetical protein
VNGRQSVDALYRSTMHADVTRVARPTASDPIWFRSAMSAGNLHPVELDVVR